MPAHRLPDRLAPPGQSRGTCAPLDAFNTAPAESVRQSLLTCLHSLRWATSVTTHRPYPDLDSLLAAADEAAYDLSPADVAEALAAESLPVLPDGTYEAAHTALNAAYAAYEARFGHVFVIHANNASPDETLNHILTAIRSRLANDTEEERVVVVDELRRLAKGRLVELLRGAGL
ncbi:2-oxo-4-hydroxy-4-carboxy-5-ureidoimidazoline decarboxylase [Streptomyces sp. NPDC052773]|uniref:2-oxo-4-hydroxy-4-carboxy-5-ureidoimidazoline decarboxylase n=1 Tax=Streptomyces sp. NPDC052773 TaxID=3365693 RepID=UPI0037D52A8A